MANAHFAVIDLTVPLAGTAFDPIVRQLVPEQRGMHQQGSSTKDYSTWSVNPIRQTEKAENDSYS
jgi:hypothetical protein